MMKYILSSFSQETVEEIEVIQVVASTGVSKLNHTVMKNNPIIYLSSINTGWRIVLWIKK